MLEMRIEENESPTSAARTHVRLNVKGLALALGLTWAAGVFVLGLVGAVGWGRELIDVLGSVYLGFRPTPIGIVVGTVWAFVDGALGGAVVAWLYNRFC